ncbi:site-specific integrase [Porifericola rhodea]|uniref:site-specific integrase n=1 Tax=Porifericola rhodea TaxID=930972 RepID=UPI0026671684|nr:site-specific integrase [Porifericola rhodea]WKN33775.1 site-specific integrase [Porifericola rhodea]
MAKVKEVTVKIVAPKYRKKSDGKLPIYLRVVYDRDKKEYSIKLSTTETNFNNAIGRYKKDKEGNIKLNAIQTKAETIISELQSEGKFSFYQFEEKLFGRETKHTVYTYLQSIADAFEEEGRLGTARPYKNVLSELKKYTRNRSLKFEDIRVAFLQKFERSLKLKGVKQTSISIYLRSLRAAYNRAIKEKIVKQDFYPFKEFKIRNGSSQKIALSKNDMLRIINYPAEPNSEQKDCINFFALSYYLRGMNFTDMCKLRWDTNFFDGRLVYERQKTERSNQNPSKISIEVKDHIAKIIQEYADNDPYILPVLEPGITHKTERYRIHGWLKKINCHIRTIAEELQIPEHEKLTFYTARHTYATVLKFNGVSVEQISESLGHSSINTTKNYLRSFGDEVLDKNDDYLT